MIAIVDYGVNNLASVRHALYAAGGTAEVTADPAVVAGATGIILPGVGAAPVGMERLRASGLEPAVRGAVARGAAVLGICLGMQLLFEWSEEGDVPCLGILPGRTRLLRGPVKVPQIGWNQVQIVPTSPLWAGILDDPYFYFVHSYVCIPGDGGLIAGETEYGETFTSAVAQGPVWGTQFHPERSGRVGIKLIANFVAACRPANERSQELSPGTFAV